MANSCLSVGITCLLCVTFRKAEEGTNPAIRPVIVLHVAAGAIPSGVPFTALPSCFSFSCRWHLVSVPESACIVSTLPLATLVATCHAPFPLWVKPCVRYLCRMCWFAWICWICRGFDRACGHVLVLLGLPFTKSQTVHHFLDARASPEISKTCNAIPGSVPITSFPRRFSKLTSRHVSS